MSSTERGAIAALAVLQGVLLLALFTQTPPHPPLSVPPFALGPFLAASLAVCVAALYAGTRRSAFWLGSAACALALVSFGPQKYFDPKFGEIWPAVIAGQVAIAAFAARCAQEWRSRVDTNARQVSS